MAARFYQRGRSVLTHLILAGTLILAWSARAHAVEVELSDEFALQESDLEPEDDSVDLEALTWVQTLPKGTRVELDSGKLEEITRLPVLPEGRTELMGTRNGFVSGIRIVSVPGMSEEEVAKLNQKSLYLPADALKKQNETPQKDANSQSAQPNRTWELFRPVPVYHRAWVENPWMAAGPLRRPENAYIKRYSADLGAVSSFLPTLQGVFAPVAKQPFLSCSELFHGSISADGWPLLKQRILSHPENNDLILRKSFNRAIEAYFKNHGKLTNKRFITAIDYTMPSSEKRMFILDTETGQVSRYLVAHGQGSGQGNEANRFSNTPNSYASSVGFYTTGCPENSAKVGFSMPLVGWDSTNSNAFDRGIKVHCSSYVNEEMVRNNGRVGRSQGCPAVDQKHCGEIISKARCGSAFYAYGGDTQ